ncbi:hypothetical protein COLO4_03666 [Corchorus olitorius]|uniref:Uncharacterized protein n=1 Tax=Corchorus olitorius TaxID=93759 RepID=A0A1R3KXL3_9ROSI|nr:hypothetical protein COLO4_03666 [Corchorus olitorius]
MEQGFSIRCFKPEDSSPRSFTKRPSASTHGPMGSNSCAMGKGKQGLPSSSLLASGRQGAFREHIDSLLLHRKTVAHALMAPEKSCEIISQFVPKPKAQVSGEEVNSKCAGQLALLCGSDADYEGDMRVGKKESDFQQRKRNQAIVEGGADNGLGLNESRRGSSGPNTLEQLYGSIPGVGPTMLGMYPYTPNQFDMGLVGKRQRAEMMEVDAGSAAGQEDSFTKNMKNQVAGSLFVVGSDVAGNSRQVRKFKKTTLVSAKYSFDNLAAQANLRKGGRICTGCLKLGKGGLGEDNEAKEVRLGGLRN